ncbi:MAG: M28 family peptidase [Saprospirales bacterium]|nr:MAG: M28 family peptidase [Saprospirales bacterium]
MQQTSSIYKLLTILTAFGLVLIMTSCGTKLPTVSTLSPLEQLTADINYLASEELEGRETGTKGEQLAAAYIAERFENIGLEAAGDHGTWYQTFTGTQLPHPHARAEEGKEITGINVVGYIDNKAPYTVVVGAHYDHIGWGEKNSLYTGDSLAIHYGADDNASGVAMMLYLASRLSAGIHTSNNYIFIAFSGEEKGLWGSGYWTKNPTVGEIENLNYMLNFDMVGRLNEDRQLMINGTATSSLWERRLPRANRSNLDLTFSQSGIGGSDHTSFYLVEVPAIHFFTGLHDDYHRPWDTPDKINYSGMLEIGSFALNLIGKLDGEDKLDFSKTQQEESRMAPRFTVTLGVIPDYMFSGNGLKLEGVTSGNPAEKAGLQRGDIIIKLGEIEITDIYDYMQSLSEFESGDEAELHYRRDGELIETTVKF